MEQGLGLFSEIGVEVDITEDPTDDTNEGLDVTLKVKEPRRFTGGVHTLVGNNDGSLMVSCKVSPKIICLICQFFGRQGSQSV